jgi:O-antigen/teichoic acid export membrane protein
LQVFKNIKIGVFISLVNILIQGVSVLVQNLIARNLGTVDFGYFGVLQTDYTVFCAIADFGMATLILAYFGKRATEGRLFTSVLQMRLAMTAITAAAMVIFAFTVRRDHPAFAGELVLALGLLFQHAFFDWYFICGNFWKKLLISKVLHTISYTTVMMVTLYVFRVDSIPAIALAMVAAALPAFGFGVRQAFTTKVLRIGNHTLKFFKLMLKSASPYALASIASFAYLPVGLYTVAHFAKPEFLGAYNFSHKLVILASGLMVHFISSSLITLHQTDSKALHLRDQAVFTLFIIAVSSPFWLFPQYTLRIIFFAAPWTSDVLETSCHCLRILALSLTLQATRMGMISTLLKEKRTWLYGAMITAGGIINIGVCIGGASMLQASYIPALTLTGDLCLSLFLLCYFIKNRRFRW